MRMPKKILLLCIAIWIFTFSSCEWIKITEDPPQINEDGVYVIITAGQLASITDMSADYCLGADIDLSDLEEASWTPISTGFTNGSTVRPFEGTFDGKGFTISNLRINEGNICSGLFGKTGKNAKLKNITLTQVDIKSSHYVGALIGKNLADVTNCHTYGSVSGSRTVGGLIGSNEGTLTDCSSSGSVCAESGQIGGLVGINEGDVENCTTSCSVHSDFSSAGGFIGENRNIVKNCSAQGSVFGKSDCGGFIGNNKDEGVVTNCSASGDVIGESSHPTGSGEAGGFIGYNKGKVSSCYSVGSVSSNMDYCGGFIGYNWGGECDQLLYS